MKLDLLSLGSRSNHQARQNDAVRTCGIDQPLAVGFCHFSLSLLPAFVAAIGPDGLYVSHHPSPYAPLYDRVLWLAPVQCDAVMRG
jgi:hypothetical protein